MMVAADADPRRVQTIRDPEGADAETKVVGIFAMVTVGMLMIFGLLDLQLSNFRDMLFTGFWVGLMVAAPGLARAPAPGAPASRALQLGGRR